jgi:hypothetical protein
MAASEVYNLIHKGVAWGKGFVAQGVTFGKEQIAKLRKMLMERVKQGLAYAREMARGKIQDALGNAGRHHSASTATGVQRAMLW